MCCTIKLMATAIGGEPPDAAAAAAAPVGRRAEPERARHGDSTDTGTGTGTDDTTRDILPSEGQVGHGEEKLRGRAGED